MGLMILFRNVLNTRITFLNLFLAATPTNNKDKLVNDTMNEVISQYSNWFILSSKEIDTLKSDLLELQKGINCSDAMTILRNEITNLKSKVCIFILNNL